MFSAHAAVQLKRRHQEAARIDRYNSGYSLTLLEPTNTKTMNQIKDLVHSTFKTCFIDRVDLVNHRQMYGMYLLRKEEMEQNNGFNGLRVEELMLYHSTTESRAMESLKNGLDWRRTKRSKFGRGVSFSDDADYANFYANNSSTEDYRVILVCSVLVAKKHKVTNKANAGYNLDTPPGLADTTVSPNGRVYVKFNDFEFYPLYLVYYRRKPDHLSSSRYFKGNGNQNQKQPTQSPLQDVQQQQRQLTQQQQRELKQQRELEQQRRYHEELMRLQEILRQKRQQEQRLQEEQQRQRELQQNRSCNYDRQKNCNNCLIL